MPPTPTSRECGGRKDLPLSFRKLRGLVPCGVQSIFFLAAVIMTLRPVLHVPFRPKTSPFCRAQGKAWAEACPLGLGIAVHQGRLPKEPLQDSSQGPRLAGKKSGGRLVRFYASYGLGTERQTSLGGAVPLFSSFVMVLKACFEPVLRLRWSPGAGLSILGPGAVQQLLASCRRCARSSTARRRRRRPRLRSF